MWQEPPQLLAWERRRANHGLTSTQGQGYRAVEVLVALPFGVLCTPDTPNLNVW